MRLSWTAAISAALSLVLAGVAMAQGAVSQSGPVTPFHAPTWYGNGVVADAGTPSTPFLSALGLFNGASCPFGVSSQTGPGQSLTPYGLFTVCQTLTTTTLTVSGVNGAATPTLYINIGGVNYPFPGSGGGVAGPATTVSGDVACWNNLVGTLLSDCGARLVTPGTTVSGDFPCWNNTTGTLLNDCGIPSTIATNSILGNISGSTGLLTAVSLPANCNASNTALNWTVGVGWSCRSITGGSGSVTQVNTGPGLTGGPITTTGTISATTTLNAQTGTSYTVLASDSAGIVTLNNGSAIAVTVPQPTGSFGAGYATTLCDLGAGTATLTPTSSTIGGASTYLLTTGNCVSAVSDGSNYQVIPQLSTITGLTMGATQALLCSATAPTVTSAGTSPSITDNNGTCSFTVNVGTGGSATAVVLALPTAAHGWTCAGSDVTTQSTTVFLQKQTASSTTAATITNFNTSGSAAAFVASDKLRMSCHAD